MRTDNRLHPSTVHRPPSSAYPYPYPYPTYFYFLGSRVSLLPLSFFSPSTFCLCILRPPRLNCLQPSGLHPNTLDSTDHAQSCCSACQDQLNLPTLSVSPTPTQPSAVGPPPSHSSSLDKTYASPSPTSRHFSIHQNPTRSSPRTDRSESVIPYSSKREASLQYQTYPKPPSLLRSTRLPLSIQTPHIPHSHVWILRRR